MSNPFFYGNPASPEQFTDRQQELRRVIGRIVSQGQSTAVVGEPRSGKTSLLLYLSAPEMRARLYPTGEEQLLFSYTDAHMLGTRFNQAQFWEHSLSPLHKVGIANGSDSRLADAYGTCQSNGFGAFVLERFFVQTKASGWRLVLLLDEFDVLLHHQVLNCAEFFGSLRSLASRSRGGLVLVIASRQSLTALNADTRQFSRASSPYFNFLSEVTLRPFPHKARALLLDRAGDRFTSDDRRFISDAAGGHPYLLQVAASEMWQAHAEGQDDHEQRRQQVGRRLNDEAALTLGDTWQLWPPEMRMAFTVVALADVTKMLKLRRFYRMPLDRDKRDLGPELRSLERQGFIAKQENLSSTWQVRPQVFLWWLADEIARTVRHERSFKKWLRKQDLGFLLTRGEREQLDKALRGVGELLKDGASTLIEAAAKGMGAAMTGSV